MSAALRLCLGACVASSSERFCIDVKRSHDRVSSVVNREWRLVACRVTADRGNLNSAALLDGFIRRPRIPRLLPEMDLDYTGLQVIQLEALIDDILNALSQS